VGRGATAARGARFLVGDARRAAAQLVDDFRRRALAAALALVVLGTLALVVIAAGRPQLLVAMFTTAALPFVLAAMVFTPLAAGLLWRRVFKLYRLLTVAAVG